MKILIYSQRVLTNLLRIRLHYSHPVVFDRLFFITRGGTSKSSTGINLSEDIYLPVITMLFVAGMSVLKNNFRLAKTVMLV